MSSLWSYEFIACTLGHTHTHVERGSGIKWNLFTSSIFRFNLYVQCVHHSLRAFVVVLFVFRLARQTFYRIRRRSSFTRHKIIAVWKDKFMGIMYFFWIYDSENGKHDVSSHLWNWHLGTVSMCSLFFHRSTILYIYLMWHTQTIKQTIKHAPCTNDRPVRVSLCITSTFVSLKIK